MRYTKKLVVKGELKNYTPLHIGSAEDSFETDMPIICNGNGIPYIPATSIGGVIRAYLEDVLGENNEYINLFLGTQDKNKKQIKSHLIIEDAELKTNNFRSEIREHTAINRLTLSAFEKSKFDEEVIPAGSKFNFGLELNIDEKYEQEFKEMLIIIIRALEESKIFIGAKSSAGFGRIKLETTKISLYDFKNNKLEALDDYIQEKEKPFEDYKNFKIKKLQLKQLDYAYISIQCKIPYGLLIKSGSVINDSDADLVQFVSRNINGELTAVIPGSSLKGIFRTRADMIIRTVKNENDIKSKLLDEIKEKYGNEININELEKYLIENKYLIKLFGTSFDYKTKTDYKNKKALVEENGRIFFEDAYLYGDKKSKKKTTHIKVDRFTGGAIDGALYNIEAVWNNGDDIYFDLNIYIKNAKLHYLGLIAHCLKDLFFGDLRIGYGTRRGLGKVEFSQIKKLDISIGDFKLTKEEFEGKKLPLTDEDLIKNIKKISDRFNNWKL